MSDVTPEERLEQAYQAHVEEFGTAPTVRELRAKANVRTVAAAGYLRDLREPPKAMKTPAIPEALLESLSTQVWNSAWNTAWKAAQTAARSDSAVAIQQAIEAKDAAEKRLADLASDNTELRKERDRLKKERDKTLVDLGKAQGQVSIQHDLLSDANTTIARLRTDLAEAQQRATTAETITESLRQELSELTGRK